VLSIAGAAFVGDVTLNAILGRFLLFLLLTSAVSSAAMRALRNTHSHHDDHVVTTRTLLEAVRRHDTTEQTIVELVTGAYIGDKDEARLAELLLDVDEVCKLARRCATTHEWRAS
jgi:hypothetical protein